MAEAVVAAPAVPLRTEVNGNLVGSVQVLKAAKVVKMVMADGLPMLRMLYIMAREVGIVIPVLQADLAVAEVRQEN